MPQSLNFTNICNECVSMWLCTGKHAKEMMAVVISSDNFFEKAFHCVAQANLKLMILLPQPPTCAGITVKYHSVHLPSSSVIYCQSTLTVVTKDYNYV